MKYIVCGLIIIGLIGLFILGYLLNKKTPKPDGCEGKGEACKGCQILSCSHHLENKEGEENK